MPQLSLHWQNYNSISYHIEWEKIVVTVFLSISNQMGIHLVGEPRDQNKANFNKVRQIAKFGMIVYYKIVINNLI